MSVDAGDAHHRLLRRIAAELRVASAERFEHRPLGDGDAPPSTSGVTAALATFVYTHYYLGESAASAASRRMAMGIPIVAREDAAFGARLRAANRGNGFTDDGWRIVGARDGAALVRKRGVTLVAHALDLAGAGPFTVGAEVGVRFPNERPYAYPDYYMAIGDGGPTSAEGGEAVVRIYFNVSADGAGPLLTALTTTLGAELGRFCVKVLNHPDAYPRPDAAVAYVRRPELARARALVDDVVAAVGGVMNAQVPAFTLPLARGIAVAEEPPPTKGVAMSFGQHRSALVARGLVKAFSAGGRDAGQRLRWIVRELEAAGIDPARPYLNAGSPDFGAPNESGMKSTCGH